MCAGWIWLSSRMQLHAALTGTLTTQLLGRFPNPTPDMVDRAQAPLSRQHMHAFGYVSDRSWGDRLHWRATVRLSTRKRNGIPHSNSIPEKYPAVCRSCLLPEWGGFRISMDVPPNSRVILQFLDADMSQAVAANSGSQCLESGGASLRCNHRGDSPLQPQGRLS